MFRRFVFMLSLVLFSVFIAASAMAHELILVPQQWDTYVEGQELPFWIVSSHVFMKSAELENPDNVEASYAGKNVDLYANDVFGSFDGKITLQGGGATVLRAHRKGAIWSKTTQGMKEGGRKELDGVIEARLYEKFCKTLLPVDGNTAGWDKPVGDALEIMPLDNPLELAPGDSFRVQVLYKGKPVATDAVTATYDGFSDAENTYAYYTEPYGEGEAVLKVSEPGFWMVRVQYAVPVEGKDYDIHMLRAVLAFPVAER